MMKWKGVIVGMTVSVSRKSNEEAVRRSSVCRPYVDAQVSLESCQHFTNHGCLRKTEVKKRGSKP